MTDIYTMTNTFPKSEQYGLVSQMRRASVSIPSNIAEGSRRKTKKDFCQFVVVAFGSRAELETQIEIAKRLNYIKEKSYKNTDMLLDEIMRMLNKLIASLRTTN